MRNKIVLNYIISEILNVEFEWVAVPFYILEGPGSDLDPEAGKLK
jgi:hypothetical protein